MDIIKIPELVGRTIVTASAWSDGESMSFKLDDGSILQISATMFKRPKNDPAVRWEIEFPPKP